MAKKLILGIILILIFTNCEEPEEKPPPHEEEIPVEVDPDTTYFPTGLGYSWGYRCQNEYFDWITLTVDSVYFIAGFDCYRTQAYREGVYLDQSRIEFYDIGRAWGFKDDSVIGYGFDGRVALPLFPQTGDTFTTAFYNSKAEASYTGDTLYINGIVFCSENEEEASYNSWYTKRVIGEGMVNLVDSFYRIDKTTNEITYLKITTWD